MTQAYRSPNDKQFFGSSLEASYTITASYEQQMMHLENAKNVLVYRYPDDPGVSFLVDANITFTSLTQLLRHHYNIYDELVYPQYPTETYLLNPADRHTLIPGDKFPFLLIKRGAAETYILMRCNIPEPITKKNWMRYVAQQAPGSSTLPVGGKVIMTLEYEG